PAPGHRHVGGRAAAYHDPDRGAGDQRAAGGHPAAGSDVELRAQAHRRGDRPDRAWALDAQPDHAVRALCHQAHPLARLGAVREGAMIGWIYSSLLLSLRISPVFALAPPFSLTRMPVLFRALFGVGVAAIMVWSNPAAAAVSDFGAGNLTVIAARELMLGGIFVLAFQLAYAALYMAGRTVDIQAGFG